MEGTPTTYFLREIFPQLALMTLLPLFLLWFPWKRLIWLPKNPEKLEGEAYAHLLAGREEAAIHVFEHAYGITTEHAKAIVDWLRQKKKSPNQAPEPTPTAVTPPAGQEARQP